MREILFRGKRTDNGVWVYGLLSDLTVTLSRETAKITQRGTVWGIEVVPQTVEQFTGLVDKNGTKIFERDVLKNTLDNSIAIVKWGTAHNGFVLETKGTVYAFARTGCEVYKVIGNIHDDPELLTGGKCK